MEKIILDTLVSVISEIENDRQYSTEITTLDLIKISKIITRQINNLNIAGVVGSDLLHDLLTHEEEIISSPLRFNGVHVAKIKQVFERHGIPYNSSF